MILLVIAVLSRIASNPLGNVYQKQLTAKGFEPLFINFFTYLGLSIICIFISFGVSWNMLPMDFWIYSILGGIVGAIGNGLLVKALQTGDLSVLGPINSYKSVISLIVGIFLLGEVPNLWGVLGIALIIYGSYFVLDTTEERFSWRLLKKPEIQYRIWAMILTAIEAVFTKKVINVSSTLISFIIWCWFGALFSFVLLLIYKIRVSSQASQIIKSGFRQYLLLLLCVGIMQLSTNYAFDNMPVGYALSLFQLSVIFSVVLGHRLFNEQNISKKLIGSAIMVIGSVAIILLKDK